MRGRALRHRSWRSGAWPRTWESHSKSCSEQTKVQHWEQHWACVSGARCRAVIRKSRKRSPQGHFRASSHLTKQKSLPKVIFAVSARRNHENMPRRARIEGGALSRSAARQPVQQRRSVQSKKYWERRATKAVATAATAGRPSSITTREYDELMKAVGGQPKRLATKRRGSRRQRRPQTIKAPSGLLTVGAPEEEIRVMYNTGSSDGCPTAAARDDSPAAVSATTSNQAHALTTAALSATSTDHIQRRLRAQRTISEPWWVYCLMSRHVVSRFRGTTSRFWYGHSNKGMIWPRGREGSGMVSPH